ncbi:MAG: HIT domain-containing protein [Candidatus Binatus sp.]|uniref:HIT family protein n=1 Tax=Candidatus Binatus sp. TaxID=2811406 RepID=UPI002718256C|nr:HIT domain-containing protein [Candidatus Binatus sp.]MDO8433087.1 HIT domain-containing protein [Candidatus Binatus sp.]
MAPKQRTSSRPEAAAAPEFRLFAPWRFDYVKRSGAPKECIFCFGPLIEAERRKRLVVFDHRDAVVMLNRYPYTNGHLMVAPRRHVASPELLNRGERNLVGDLIAKSVEVMRPLTNASGFNLGANLGRSAGAGFADHLHWHVVPRYEGDANFMTVLASTRVLSQSLEDSFKSLRPLFKNAAADLS